MMNPAKVLISAILMPVMAIPAIAQGQQYLMHEDGGTNYSVCYTGVFYDHKPKWQQLTAFPIYKLFWCIRRSGSARKTHAKVKSSARKHGMLLACTVPLSMKLMAHGKFNDTV
jgi:hypothetical protein